jgi:hypothetical protein
MRSTLDEATAALSSSTGTTTTPPTTSAKALSFDDPAFQFKAGSTATEEAKATSKPAQIYESVGEAGERSFSQYPVRKNVGGPVTAAKGGKNWIAGAIKKPGALRASMGVKKGQKIPAKKLAAAAKKSGVTGRRARLAQTLKKMG